MNYFSIIVPVYNSEKYIYGCIKSVQEQTFKNFELILIIDGNSDNSHEICKEFALQDNRIKIIYTQHVGVSGARNIGLREANGEYILFLDSDDKLYDMYVLEKINKRITSTNFDMYIYNYINSKGKKFENREKTYIEKEGHNLIESSLKDRMNIPSTIWRCVIKREKITNVFLNEKYTYGEDVDFFFKSVRCLRTFEYVDEYIVIYNVSNDKSINANVRIKDLECCNEILKENYEYYKNLDDNKKYKRTLTYLCNRYFNILIKSYWIDDNEQISINKEMFDGAKGVVYFFSKIILKLLGNKIGAKVIANIFLVINRRK